MVWYAPQLFLKPVLLLVQQPYSSYPLHYRSGFLVPDVPFRPFGPHGLWLLAIDSLEG